MIHPRVFISEYVEPAIALWQTHQDAKHLAIHAMTQVDVLAEVVARQTLLGARRTLPKEELGRFRTDLETKRPILAVIRDAHDCHKHGALDRKSAKAAREGQRPETAHGAGFFVDVTFLGGPPTPYTYLVFRQDDGTEITIFDLLTMAMEAWNLELTDRGL